jgi:hypothetical protein
MVTRRRPAPGTPRSARFGVYLDTATREALLVAAIKEGTSATALVERLIRDYLRQRRGVSRKG